MTKCTKREGVNVAKSGGGKSEPKGGKEKLDKMIDKWVKDIRKGT